MVRSVIEGSVTTAAAARQFQCPVANRIKRFRAEGVGGLQDHS